MVTFIHTADWQIGKQFANIPGDVGAIVRERRVETVKLIAAIATERKVDAVLVAGDLFDSNLIQSKTIWQTIAAMAEFTGKWLIIPGNHDSADSDSAWARLKKIWSSENIHVLDKPEPYYLRSANTVILPAPLQRRHESRDLTVWFDDCVTDPSLIRIGLAHGSMQNRLLKLGDAPNTIADTRSDSAKLDYFALGDWHGTSKIAPRTWYSGTPEPDRFRENDSGNILMVEIDSPGKEPQVTPIATGYFRWLSHELSIFQASDIASIKQMLLETGHPLDRILLRLTLNGAVSLESRAGIDGSLEMLSAELRYLESDFDGLRAEPIQSDLDDIERSGFVRTAINKLASIAADASDVNAETARLALNLLYVEHKQLETSDVYKKN
jgi:DNA repair exonuclease SbcCD nuclease subunit